jgi:hypothetical protein
VVTEGRVPHDSLAERGANFDLLRAQILIAA